jgi:hypothetical protein
MRQLTMILWMSGLLANLMLTAWVFYGLIFNGVMAFAESNTLILYVETVLVSWTIFITILFIINQMKEVRKE